MRIAQIAPLIESVPPHGYGGTERVVAYLTEELARQGHDVTLFASGDSRTSARGVADSLEVRAEALRVQFEERFWCEDLGTYALALDGDKAPCAVASSNAGHALLAGIAGEDRARRTGRTLVGPDSFSGWGIRTLATTEVRYNRCPITTDRSGRTTTR